MDDILGQGFYIPMLTNDAPVTKRGWPGAYLPVLDILTSLECSALLESVMSGLFILMTILTHSIPHAPARKARRVEETICHPCST